MEDFIYNNYMLLMVSGGILIVVLLVFVIISVRKERKEKLKAKEELGINMTPGQTGVDLSSTVSETPNESIFNTQTEVVNNQSEQNTMDDAGTVVIPADNPYAATPTDIPVKKEDAVDEVSTAEAVVETTPATPEPEVVTETVPVAPAPEAVTEPATVAPAPSTEALNEVQPEANTQEQNQTPLETQTPENNTQTNN